MKVFLDEMPLGRQPATVADALRAAAQSAELVGRIIVSVAADGRAINEAELSQLELANTAVAELRLISADPHTLIREVFQDAQHALLTLTSLQRAAADACATGDSQATMAQLGGVVETWKAVRDALSKGAELLSLDLDTFRYSHQGRDHLATAQVTALAAALDLLLSGVRAQDWSAVGDALSYDLDPLATSWGALFAELERLVARRP